MGARALQQGTNFSAQSPKPVQLKKASFIQTKVAQLLATKIKHIPAEIEWEGVKGIVGKEMEAKLRVLTGYPKMQSAAIGPAGEHLSLISAIMNDGHRAAAKYPRRVIPFSAAATCCCSTVTCCCCCCSAICCCATICCSSAVKCCCCCSAICCCAAMRCFSAVQCCSAPWCYTAIFCRSTISQH